MILLACGYFDAGKTFYDNGISRKYLCDTCSNVIHQCPWQYERIPWLRVLDIWGEQIQEGYVAS